MDDRDVPLPLPFRAAGRPGSDLDFECVPMRQVDELADSLSGIASIPFSPSTAVCDPVAQSAFGPVRQAARAVYREDVAMKG